MVTEAEGRSSSLVSRCSAWHPCPWSGWNAVLKKRTTGAAFCVALFCSLWLPGPYALALNPALDVTQYAHSAWRGREGFVSGHIYALAQTPDGYLWLGTDRGLLRFDGVRTTRWQPPTDASLPDTRILNLLVGRDGALWIGTWRGLASWNHGQLRKYPELEGFGILALAEDREGSLWVGSTSPAGASPGLLCAIRDGRSECYGRDGSFGKGVVALAEDTSGALWAVSDRGLGRWQKGSLQPYPLPDPVFPYPHNLIAMGTGGVLYLTKKGIGQVIDGKVKDYWLLPGSAQWDPRSLLVDRDGGVWIGTNGGLFHLHNGRMNKFGMVDGLSSDSLTKIFEDREGNIWVATEGGLDRFRGLSATTYTVRQGVTGIPGAVLADTEGSIWISTSMGLYRWQDGYFELYWALPGDWRQAPQKLKTSEGVAEVAMGSLFQDHSGRVWLGTRVGLGYMESNRFVAVDGVPAGYIDSIVEDHDGSLWIAHRDAGLLKLSFDRLVRQIPWTTISSSGSASRLVADPVHGGLWMGFFTGGIIHWVDGEVRASYGSREGLSPGRVNDLQIAPNGVWAATDGGVSRLTEGRIATLDAHAGLPCGGVDSIVFDEGSLWLYSGCGLIHLPASELGSWNAAVLRGRTLAPKVRTDVLGTTEGVPEFRAIGTFSPHLARTADGKLWLVSDDGLTVVDPRHLPINTLPPPIQIERVTADRQPYQALSTISLPPRVRDVEIDYTALSLVAPEKDQFRYKLEGYDRDWQNVANRRQAFYTNLSPGSYRFRVIASNNSGVWNEQGAALDFSIAPAYWQTTWFRAACVAAFLVVLWALYQLRLHQVARAFNARLDERVAERSRIARELHDTLLQNFQGLLLRFQTVLALFETRPADAKEVLKSSIDQTAQAITEGREAVQGLRASTVESNDLAQAITTLGAQLAAEASSATSVGFHVEVEGAPRNLHPIVRDEIYRITSEALRNAFRHAEAQQIEVEFRYDERQLRLRVRDDGKGIGATFLTAEGRTGHFGLHGMRERAKLMGGKLTVWTAAQSGTEIELMIPAARAYGASPRRSWFAEKFFGKSALSKS
jgi:signal transduction histidine kinase/ligand-binding sensor domain-containing protein